MMARVETEAGPTLFPQSEMAWGGLLAAVGLLDYIADTGQSLAEMVDSSPLGEWVHLRVSCPWESKARVMRLLREEMAGAGGVRGPDRTRMPAAGALTATSPAAGAGTAASPASPVAAVPVEGVQAESEKGRILVLPDADRPAFHVYSEAPDMELAEELAGFFAGRVSELAGVEPDDRA